MRSSLRSMLNRFPRLMRLLKRVAQSLPACAEVSSHYVQIQGKEAEQESSSLLDARQSQDRRGSGNWLTTSWRPCGAVSRWMYLTS